MDSEVSVQLGDDGLDRKSSKEFDGMVALITGASRGIGSVIAGRLATAGACVVVNFINRIDDANHVCAEILRGGGKADAQCADVANRSAVSKMIENTVERYGRIDVVVNNAGILSDRSFKNMQPEAWDAVIQTNLTGVYNVCREVVPKMIEQRSGSIVNISSIVGQLGNFGQANYAAAKAGILGFTKTLALELARYGVRANAVCPGFVDTAMWHSIPDDVKQTILAKIPLQRVASPADVALAVEYLIRSSYVTGETLNVNGGMHMP